MRPSRGGSAAARAGRLSCVSIVVAVSGGPESETLLRRGAWLAQRAAGSELLAVHVVTAAGLQTAQESSLARVQDLVVTLGGTFHSVVGEDAADAVVEFATGAEASTIVVGVSRRGRLHRLVAGTTGDRIMAAGGGIDVHLVAREGSVRPSRPHLASSPLSPRRQAFGWAAAVLVPLLLVWWLHAAATGSPPTEQLPLANVLLLAATVLVAVVGGRWPAVLAAVIGFLNLNWWFTAPVHRLTIAEPRNLVALIVFLAVAVGVATVVDGASRRTEEAVRARAAAAAMSALSRSVLTGQDTAEAIVARVRETFGQRSVVLLRRDEAGGWVRLAGAGLGHADRPESGDARVAVDERHVMVLRGDRLRAPDRRVLEAFATQMSLVLEYQRLREHADRAAALERAEATSTALLRAVSHDLRTPLATMRAAVDGLLSGLLAEEDRRVLVESAATSVDQLERLIDNLLDLSRVEAGLVHPTMESVSLEEVLPMALIGQPAGAVAFEAAEDAPLVRTDPGLLERVVANLVSNAVRASAGSAVRVLTREGSETVEVLIVDHGPGVPPEQRERMFEPFQRLDDTSPGGLGLGLAVARGFSDALGIDLSARETPGGGLTMVLPVPRADRAGGAPAGAHPRGTTAQPATREVR